MILDSSALVAILFKEPEAEHLAAMIRDTDTTAIAAPTLLETAIVAEGRTLRKSLMP
jgi:ribonuclease VapC